MTSQLEALLQYLEAKLRAHPAPTPITEIEFRLDWDASYSELHLIIEFALLGEERAYGRALCVLLAEREVRVVCNGEPDVLALAPKTLEAWLPNDLHALLQDCLSLPDEAAQKEATRRLRLDAASLEFEIDQVSLSLADTRSWFINCGDYALEGILMISTSLEHLTLTDCGIRDISPLLERELGPLRTLDLRKNPIPRDQTRALKEHCAAHDIELLL